MLSKRLKIVFTGLAVIAACALSLFITDSPLRGLSFQEKAELAAEYAIWGYRGTDEQNKLLISRIDSAEGTVKDAEQLGYSVVTGYRTTLASPMTSTQTTVPVSSIVTKDGHTLTMADLGSVVYLTIEPGASKEEIVKCTTISSSQWASCTRGLAFYGTTESAVSANQKTHNAGSTVVMSNVHYVYEQIADKDSSETIGGVKTFSVYPVIGGAVGSATTSLQFITLGQAQSLTNQGAATSTESIAGISELATQVEMASSTDNGVNNPLVLQAKYATSTPGIAGLYTPISMNNGKLSSLWGGSASTLATLNASSLVVENPANATATPAASKILISDATAKIGDGWVGLTTAGDILYSDGTDLQRLAIGTAGQFLKVNSGATAPEWGGTRAIKTGQSTRVDNATGTQAVTHSLGFTPSLIVIKTSMVNNAADYMTESFGTATGTSDETSTYNVIAGAAGSEEIAGQDATHIIYLVDSSGAVDGSATLSAVDTTTFTLNWDVNNGDGETRYFQWIVYP